MKTESDFYLQCLNCAHYIGKVPPAGPDICPAFRDGIPSEIMNGDFDHRNSHPRDNGIHFKLKPKNERVMIY